MQLNRRSLMAAAGVLVALIVIVVIIVATGGDDGDGDAADVDGTTTSTPSTSSSTTTTSTRPDGPVAPLTGEPIEEGSDLLEHPAIVVKISNNTTVRGAFLGIERADVVIEERIEARATRFAAIFHSDLPEAVGPIRSGRTSDLDLLSNLGRPILVYSGANGSVTGQLNALSRDGLVKLVVDRGTNVDLVRDRNFRAPDNLFSDLVEIDEKYRDDAGAAVPLFAYQRAGDPARAAGTAGPGVTVSGANIVSFVWDESRGYVRVQDGEVLVTQEDVPFVFDNLIVLEAEYRRSTIDPESIDAVTVGSGPVTVMMGGEQWVGTWERATREDSYSFKDASGGELLLDPGTTWLTLVPADTYQFEVAPEITALVLEDEG